MIHITLNRKWILRRLRIRNHVSMDGKRSPDVCIYAPRTCSRIRNVTLMICFAVRLSYVNAEPKVLYDVPYPT